MISRLRACGDYYSQNQFTWFLLKISKRANGRWVTQGCSALRLLYLRGADARGIEVQESFAWWRLSFCYVFFCAWCCRSCARRFKHILREAIQTAFAGGVITEDSLFSFLFKFALSCFVHGAAGVTRSDPGRCQNTQKKSFKRFFFEQSWVQKVVSSSWIWRGASLILACIIVFDEVAVVFLTSICWLYAIFENLCKSLPESLVRENKHVRMR